MEYVHAALLLHAADQDVTEDAVESVLDAAGVDVDSARVKSLVAALDGVDIEEAMNEAVAGGAAPAPSGGSAGGEEASDEAADEAEDEAAEEAPDEGGADEEAEEGLGGLF